jgi:hypothetical protein
MDEGPRGLISPLAVDKSLITFAFHSLTRPAFPPKSPGEKRKDGRAKAPHLRRRGDCGSEKTPPGERGLGSLSQDRVHTSFASLTRCRCGSMACGPLRGTPRSRGVIE